MRERIKRTSRPWCAPFGWSLFTIVLLACTEEVELVTDPPDPSAPARDPRAACARDRRALTPEERVSLPPDPARDPLRARRDAGADAADDVPDTGARDGASRDAPRAAERCGDGLDNDGDGEADEDCACVPDASQSCYGGAANRAGQGACVRGVQRCGGSSELGMWGRCEGWGAPRTEVCDGVDNNCDAVTDEGCGCEEGARRECYDGPDGTLGVGGCRAGTQRCDPQPVGPTRWGDCEAQVLPGTERCNGADDDCDGAIDEGCPCDPSLHLRCYDGPAATENVGRCRGGERRCTGIDASGLVLSACVMQVLPTTERCDNATDDDCDGALDCSDSDCRQAVGCADGAPVRESFDVPRHPVEVVVVVDTSSSMARTDARGVTRRQSALDALRGLLPAVDDVVNLGLLRFPEPDRCSVTTSLSASPVRGASSSILSALTAVECSGGSPITGALSVVETSFQRAPFEGPRALVLVTDGDSNCPGSPPTDALRRLYRERAWATYVLGIDGDVCENRSSLRALALAGGRPRLEEAPYYEPATSLGDLALDLRWLATQLRDCAIELTHAPSAHYDITVEFDDRPVRRGKDGWRLADESRRVIVFDGRACLSMLTAQVRVITASYGAAL